MFYHTTVLACFSGPISNFQCFAALAPSVPASFLPGVLGYIQIQNRDIIKEENKNRLYWQLLRHVDSCILFKIINNTLVKRWQMFFE